MRALARLYDGLDHLVHEIMKFGAVGAFAYLVDVVIFNLVLHFSDKPLTSKTVSTLVATLVAYAGNRSWTFRHRGRSTVRRELAMFVVLNVVGLLIALACLAVSHYLLGFTGKLADNISANVIGLGLGTTFRFWSYRRFVFPAVADRSVADDVAAAVTAAPR